MRESACESYDAMAPFYDAFTDHPGYDGWVRRLADIAARYAPRQRSHFDVACGTGKSFMPLLERMEHVTACDGSAAMLALARAKASGRAVLHRLDMRCLGHLGRFDLVTCLNDSLNYLLADGDLERALAGMCANVTPDGVVMFDVNSRLAHREFFGARHERRVPGATLRWSGRGASRRRGTWYAEATFEFVRDADGPTAPALSARHVQRHYDSPAVHAALSRARLDLLAVHGVRADGAIDPGFDEERHLKALYLARPLASDAQKGGE